MHRGDRFLEKLQIFGLVIKSMAAPPPRARADYDYLIKLLLIGDSGKLLSRLFGFRENGGNGK